MSDPLVSVVLPAYNAADTIRRAADSILNGTWRNLELIIIDDGSTDQTAEAVKMGDPRVRVVSQENEGVAHAMNRGVSEARGHLIARMDADDFSHPTRLEQQIDLLDIERHDIVGGLVRIIDREGNPVPSMQRYQSWLNKCRTHAQITAQRFIESPLVHPTTLARREVWELGCRQGGFPEDYDLWLRALQAGYRAGKVGEIVLDWIDSKKRLTRNHSRYRAEAFDYCRREHLLNGPLKAHARCGVWGAGRTGKHWLVWLQNKGVTVDYVVDVSPKKIGKRIHDVKVISHEDLPESDGRPLIVAVGAEGAREKIQQVFEEQGYKSGRDAWFVA